MCRILTSSFWCHLESSCFMQWEVLRGNHALAFRHECYFWGIDKCCQWGFGKFWGCWSRLHCTQCWYECFQILEYAIQRLQRGWIPQQFSFFFSQTSSAVLKLDASCEKQIQFHMVFCYQLTISSSWTVETVGASQHSLVEDTNPRVAEAMIQLNSTGPIALTQALVPGLLEKRKGHFVVIASMAGVVPASGQAIYSGTKFALRGYFEALRSEMADRYVGDREPCLLPTYLMCDCCCN